MKIKTKEQYHKFVKKMLARPYKVEALPLGRNHKTKSGLKKERRHIL